MVSAGLHHNPDHSVYLVDERSFKLSKSNNFPSGSTVKKDTHFEDGRKVSGCCFSLTCLPASVLQLLISSRERWWAATGRDPLSFRAIGSGNMATESNLFTLKVLRRVAFS